MEPLEGTPALDGISLDVGPFAMFVAPQASAGNPISDTPANSSH